MVAPLLHKYVYGVVPPVAVAVDEPSGVKQLVWSVLVIETESAEPEEISGARSGVDVYVSTHPEGQPVVWVDVTMASFGFAKVAGFRHCSLLAALLSPATFITSHSMVMILNPEVGIGLPGWPDGSVAL